MRIRKLYHPDILGKYCLELIIGWRSWKITGFWFRRRGWKNNVYQD